jgi:hypothetical protein
MDIFNIAYLVSRDKQKKKMRNRRRAGALIKALINK